ncbi:MAG: nuclear transport factor 2 family protein [Kofleriaceae bacterium]
MRALALVLVATTACGGGSKPAAEAPKQAAVDERTAEKDAKGLLQEVYQTIQQADTDGLMTLFAVPLVVYGPRKSDAHANRADALVALKAVVDPKKKKPSVKSDQLTIVASPGGHSAWAFDVVEVAGQTMTVTAVLSNADDVWQVSVAALAATPTMKTVHAELKKDAIVPPGMVGGVAKIDPKAKLAVDKLTRGLTAPAVWGDELDARTDAVVIGPGAGDITTGKAAIKKLFEKRIDAHVRATAAGQVTASVTADGELAWVTVPVVRFEDDTDPLPLRVFAVYEKAGGDWKMIALQESTAIDEPGGGAQFKTVVAPALPKPPEAAPAPAAVDEAKPVKKKKKKHKKPKPVDDDR